MLAASMAGTAASTSVADTPELRQPSRRAIGWLFALTAAAGLFLVLTVPLFPQETYYWLFAKHPDLSYFDHPPMVAWLIWVGSSVFGDGALGIRFGTLMCALVTTLAGMALLQDFGASRRGQFTWVLLSFGIPLFAAGHCYTTPDAPLVAFWMLAVLFLWKARGSASVGWWLLAGIAAGCALLSKYTACFLGLGGMLLLLFDPVMRRQLRTPGPWVALVVAVAVFSPVLIWNRQHGWISFLFQTEGRVAGHELTFRWFPQLVGGQFGALNPVVAIALVPGVRWAWRAWRSAKPVGFWILAIGPPLIVVFTVMSFVTQVKGNWLAPAYPMLLFAVVLWLDQSGFAARRPKLWGVGKALVWVLAIAVLAAPVIGVAPIPFVKNNWSGWDIVAERTLACRDSMPAAPGQKPPFVFALHYQPASETWHQLAAKTTRETMPVVLAQNTLGAKALEFDFWTDAASQTGADAVFVQQETDEKRIADQLTNVRARFASVEKYELIEIKRMDKIVSTVTLYACRGYRGPPVAGAPVPVIPE